MIYFLRTSPVVVKRPEWAGILTKYFDNLKSACGEDLATLIAAGKQEDREKRAESGLNARKKSCKIAFEGVDLEAIDFAWQDFVRDMEFPKTK